MGLQDRDYVKERKECDARLKKARNAKLWQWEVSGSNDPQSPSKPKKTVSVFWKYLSILMLLLIGLSIGWYFFMFYKLSHGLPFESLRTFSASPFYL